MYVACHISFPLGYTLHYMSPCVSTYRCTVVSCYVSVVFDGHTMCVVIACALYVALCVYVSCYT